MSSKRSNSRRKILSIALLLGLIIVGALAADWFVAFPRETAASFVGGARCIECHQQEGHLWEGSHHDLAMDLATPATVLGDFNDQTIDHFGITSRMYRDGDRYMVHTEGPDGEMTDFEVKYVFGCDPLQQYMVELESPTPGEPSAIGRVQVLRISWDTQRQRWFYLDPPDVTEKLQPDDPLHWTGSAQNWNHMCAECHSTNLAKGFDEESLTYATTFSEIDVSCEACHGPGSLHSEIAESKWVFWDRHHGYGLTRMKQAEARVQIETCAPCHSRRNHVSSGFACGAEFNDHYACTLLTPTTYYPDGQILDEVYVYGSFIQSKMYHNGIKCTDCHDPHTTKVKFDDNRLCTSCHQHNPAKYDTPAHHHHAVGSTGSLCIECHMPATPYMEVDLRRDHSFKTPRPELSLALQTPNACTGCHLDAEKMPAEKRPHLTYYSQWLQAARDGDQQVAEELARLDAWAANYTSQWYPPTPNEDLVIDYATIFKQASEGQLQSANDLVKIVEDRKLPGMIRATAMTWLQQFPVESGIVAARNALRDRDPQVRAAAVPFFEGVAPAQRVRDIVPLLDDSIRNVHIQAALVLAASPKSTLSTSQIEAMKESLVEYRTMLSIHGDQAPSQMGLAMLAERLGDVPAAEAAYRQAMRVQPGVTGPRSNLAALLERQQRGEEARVVREQELGLMERDAMLAPENATVQYRLGLAYYLAGDMDRAEAALKRSVEIAPGNSTYSLPLALLYRKQGRFGPAWELVDSMLKREPQNAMLRQLRAEIDAERQSAGEG